MTNDKTTEFRVGDRVYHKREPAWSGVITHIDEDCYPLEAYGVTTCVVRWDDDGSHDVQWTNKLDRMP